jgi:hypothetical protein
MTVAWAELYADLDAKAQRILKTREVPLLPAGSVEPGVGHPLAFDVDGDLAAVSFAVLDMYPDIQPGMWCLALIYRRRENAWVEACEHDNTTTPRPFERPSVAENDVAGWVDWHSNSGVWWSEEHGSLHSYFGIAPRTTARLTMTPAGGSERDIRITRFNGAYVVAVAGSESTLTGYSPEGSRLGTISYQGNGAAGGS